MRMLPAESVIGRFQLTSEVQVALDPLAAPVSSTRLSELLLLLPVALFQLVLATTPALSDALMAVPVPTKVMLTARATVVPDEGMIWIPLTGARSTPSEELAGEAVMVKLVA